MYHQTLTTGWRCLNISAHHINIVTFTPAARMWLLAGDLIYFLYPLLKLLPGLLASQPGYVPDPHTPGALQGAGLGLHLLESLWAELEELVLESLENEAVVAWLENTGGGCARAKGDTAWSWILVLVLYWLTVCLIDRCCTLIMVLNCVDSGLTLFQVLNAFTGQSCSLLTKITHVDHDLQLPAARLCPAQEVLQACFEGAD